GRSIPKLYYLLALLIAALMFVSNRRAEGQLFPIRWYKEEWHFFFLGAAFLLLEVQNISKAAVVLGSTWQVNAIIISGILVLILLANYLVYLGPSISIGVSYIGLFCSALMLYFFDLAQLAFLPYWQKAIAVGLLSTLPMLFSGVIFIRSFSIATKKNLAFGANIIGALIGALLQSLTFLIGVRALLLLVIVFYALSYLTRPGLAQKER
ncbi:hypothetical protein BVY02_01460, partial [bacterium J17]